VRNVGLKDIALDTCIAAGCMPLFCLLLTLSSWRCLPDLPALHFTIPVLHVCCHYSLTPLFCYYVDSWLQFLVILGLMRFPVTLFADGQALLTEVWSKVKQLLAACMFPGDGSLPGHAHCSGGTTGLWESVEPWRCRTEVVWEVGGISGLCLFWCRRPAWRWSYTCNLLPFYLLCLFCLFL
jgi:hypothetical protein